jgi:predicted AAA+ superfamily ATPase
VHSLGYKEFMSFFGLENNNTTLNAYLSMGGMPYLKIIGLEEYAVYEYLRNVYSTILLKDVVAREGIRNVRFLENLTLFLADHVGSIFSANNIAKYLKSQRDAVTTQAVLNYLRPLTAAYFIHKVPRFDIAGLRFFEVGEKYYFEDIGLRNAIRGYDKRNDVGKLMENAVFLHLIQQGYTVFTGQTGNYEIDFVAQKAGITVYVQVCYLLADENTVNREFGNLLKIDDNYRKYVVTMDEINPGTSYRGIEQVHLKDFLASSL